jgi:alkanesulfonate monooxygenase SsuD/methylene tetrahydromethanopterin reductase-like flavin-dependent oxidoreductase (luciferase family)
VGTGWNWVEYEALGVEYALRGKILDEQVELIQALLSEPIAEFEGRFHRVVRAGLLPRPPAKIPIWFGGFSPVAIRRAARAGDGFLFGSSAPPMQSLCGELVRQLDENGRRESFEIDVVLHYSEGEENWRSLAERWSALGATHFSMRAMDTGVHLMGEKPAGFRGVQDHIRGLERFIEVVRGVS